MPVKIAHCFTLAKENCKGYTLGKCILYDSLLIKKTSTSSSVCSSTYVLSNVPTVSGSKEKILQYKSINYDQESDLSILH